MFARALALTENGFQHLQGLLHLSKSVLSVCKSSCIRPNRFWAFARALEFVKNGWELLQVLVQGFFSICFIINLNIITATKIRIIPLQSQK